MEKLSFTNNDQIDMLGLGTWKSNSDEIKTAIHAALDAGYRHIDCAYVYGNEAAIGEALQDYFANHDLKREDIWLTSKLWNTAHLPHHVQPALQETLNALKTDYLDLYLMHWPVAFQPDLKGFPGDTNDFLSLEEAPLIDTWEAMLELKKEGLIKHAGVSNFSEKKLKHLIDKASDKPEMNQIELHPYLQQDAMLEFANQHGIHLTAYSPLGSKDRIPQMKAPDEPSLLENPVINDIAYKHKASPAQILIKWAIERKTIVIPKSTNPERIMQNFESTQIELDQSDHQKIKELDQHFRYVNGKFFETEDGKYENIFDE
ncbi:MAG: aldo/keto reductase [Psychroflexus sp.]|jgi:alcohol dehydrogenase (NADP+)|nr:aldo/keto reductase [Psychroflexus sp.]